MIYIFLDFDGVLHTQNGRRFSLMDNFTQIVKQYPQIQIVFSTSWREHNSLEVLKNYFPISLHKQCIGVTPLIRQSIEHVRFHEIEQYIKENNITQPWIAIDDMEILFPKKCEHLFLVNGKEGMSPLFAKKLEEKIKQLMNLNEQPNKK